MSDEKPSSGNSFLFWLLALFGVGAGTVYFLKKEKPEWFALPHGPTPWRGGGPLPPHPSPRRSPRTMTQPTQTVAIPGRLTAILQQAQQKLNDLGYGPLAITGQGDSPTTQAVLKFQHDKGLHVDGSIGPQTLGALGLSMPAPTVLPPNSYQPSLDEAAQTLADAYQAVAGSAPSTNTLALLMAQTSFETRPKGQTTGWNLPNFNWGGVKATSMDPFVQYFGTNEGQGSATQHLTLAFAAYQTAPEGAEAYVRVLHSRPAWWAGLQSGTPEGLIQGLTKQPYPYFTGAPSSYLAGLRGLMVAYTPTASKYAGQGVG